MRKGLTLIELTIVIALFSILTVAVFWSFTAGLRTWGSGKNRAAIRQDGSLAIQKMTRELSQAYSIRAANEDEITFWADAAGEEEISFVLEDTALLRKAGSIETVLTFDAQTFALSYRDLYDDVMTLPQDTASQGKRDNIRIVVISLNLNKGGEAITLSSGVYTRNQGL